MPFSELVPVPSSHHASDEGQLRLAVAAYLARFTGSSRSHAESDLRCYLTWCAERGMDPLAARRPHLELYIRWMQEIRKFKPSTVSRRFSVAAGFYRTCVIDGALEHSPAEHVRRPAVPPESPTLGSWTEQGIRARDLHRQINAPLAVPDLVDLPHPARPCQLYYLVQPVNDLSCLPLRRIRDHGCLRPPRRAGTGLRAARWRSSAAPGSCCG